MRGLLTRERWRADCADRRLGARLPSPQRHLGNSNHGRACGRQAVCLCIAARGANARICRDESGRCGNPSAPNRTIGARTPALLTQLRGRSYSVLGSLSPVIAESQAVTGGSTGGSPIRSTGRWAITGHDKRCCRSPAASRSHQWRVSRPAGRPIRLRVWPDRGRHMGPLDAGAREQVDGLRAAAKAVAMSSRISHTSFDARKAYAQSVFWSEVLGFAEDPDDPNEPGHGECLITSRDRSQFLLFITVPDDKKVKNRVHLDLRPVDRTREQGSNGSWLWGRHSLLITGDPMAVAGSPWPIPRATNSASCPRNQLALAPLPDNWTILPGLVGTSSQNQPPPSRHERAWAASGQRREGECRQPLDTGRHRAAGPEREARRDRPAEAGSAGAR
jgi:glyoxalase superfamily protein